MKKTATTALALTGALSMALAGCSAETSSPSDPSSSAPPVSQSIDWRQFEGEKITLLFNAHPWTDAMAAELDEFKSLTGIDVDLQTFSEDLYWDRYAAALRAGSGVADVYFQSMDDTAFNDFENGFLTPLGDFIDDPSMTADDYDFTDYPAPLIDAARFPFGSSEAQPYGIPISTETFILYYNEEIVAEYLGGVVPETIDELVVAAEKITNDSGGTVYGAVMRGLRSTGIRDPLTAVLINSVGDPAAVELPHNVWFDGDFSSPNLTDDAIVEGMDAYARLVAAGPSNALALDWPDATALFSQGQAAFFIDATAFSPTFENPDESLVAGKVGYAPIPASSRGQGTGFASWGLGIPANSDHKGAAWYFVQWATNKRNTALFGQATGGAARVSSASDAGYIDALDSDFVRASGEALELAAPTAVYLEGWSDQMMVIVDAMQDIASGGPARDVMQAAQSSFEATFSS